MFSSFIKVVIYLRLDRFRKYIMALRPVTILASRLPRLVLRRPRRPAPASTLPQTRPALRRLTAGKPHLRHRLPRPIPSPRDPLCHCRHRHSRRPCRRIGALKGDVFALPHEAAEYDVKLRDFACLFWLLQCTATIIDKDRSCIFRVKTLRPSRCTVVFGIS